MPEAILNKPGPLTDEEWNVMRTHPEVGERILQPIQSLQAILPIVRTTTSAGTAAATRTGSRDAQSRSGHA